MALSDYHKKYAALSDAEIQRRADIKERELKTIFSVVPCHPAHEHVRIFVVGCGDRRFIDHHRRIFSSLLGRDVDLTTSDIAIEHLAGAPGVIRHDATKPFPGGPYDITYAHVFLKFIETEKQWDVLMNSWNALREGGIAIHVMDLEEIDAPAAALDGGLHAVPLTRWKKQLEGEGIHFKEAAWKIEGILKNPLSGRALILLKERKISTHDD